jgi:SnoaL-like domain
VAGAFRQAVEARDVEGMAAALHPDVTFRSPVVFRPYEGRDAVIALLSLVTQVFEDFEYLDELQGEGPSGPSTCLIFRARVGDRQLEGIDYLRHGPDGRVTELTVMVRPYSAATALRDAMGAKLAAASS